MHARNQSFVIYRLGKKEGRGRGGERGGEGRKGGRGERGGGGVVF